jgi:hypothetical protein
MRTAATISAIAALAPTNPDAAMRRMREASWGSSNRRPAGANCEYPNPSATASTKHRRLHPASPRLTWSAAAEVCRIYQFAPSARLETQNASLSVRSVAASAVVGARRDGRMCCCCPIQPTPKDSPPPAGFVTNSMSGSHRFAHWPGATGRPSPVRREVVCISPMCLARKVWMTTVWS